MKILNEIKPLNITYELELDKNKNKLLTKFYSFKINDLEKFFNSIKIEENFKQLFNFYSKKFNLKDFTFKLEPNNDLIFGFSYYNDKKITIEFVLKKNLSKYKLYDFKIFIYKFKLKNFTFKEFTIDYAVTKWKYSLNISDIGFNLSINDDFIDLTYKSIYSNNKTLVKKYFYLVNLFPKIKNKFLKLNKITDLTFLEDHRKVFEDLENDIFDINKFNTFK